MNKFFELRLQLAVQEARQVRGAVQSSPAAECGSTTNFGGTSAGTFRMQTPARRFVSTSGEERTCRVAAEGPHSCILAELREQQKKRRWWSCDGSKEGRHTRRINKGCPRLRRHEGKVPCVEGQLLVSGEAPWFIRNVYGGRRCSCR